MRPVLKRCKRRKEGHITNNKREHQNVDNGQANHVRTTEEVNGCRLLMLPTHLIFDILARLPVYSIFNCKCVCQTFKKILLDPCFAEVHVAKASRDDYSVVIQDIDNPSKIFLTPLLDLDKHALDSKTIDHCDGKYFSWQTLTMPSLISKTRTSAYLIGSCNGLLCLRYFLNGDEVIDKIIHFCVCNPILGEFTILPRFTEFTLEFGGFGFCPKTKQYKVLRFIPQFGYCDILTLGRDEDWRRISDSPPHPDRVMDLDSSYKGNLHWIVKHYYWSKKPICSFNIETERHSYISLPSFFNNTPEIGTLDGLFCVSCFFVPIHFEVYVMEDYELGLPWIKIISIDTGYIFGLHGGYISTVRFLDNGVLVLERSSHLVYYDTRKGTYSDILVDGRYSAKVHTPSLVSLKNIMRGGNVEEVERKMFHIFSSKASKCRGE